LQLQSTNVLQWTDVPNFRNSGHQNNLKITALYYKMPKLCEFENCKSRACYGFFYACPIRCPKHKEEKMRSQYKICKCGKAGPLFNEPNETQAIYCKSCKTKSAIDIKNKRCRCGKSRPSFNEPNNKIAICCAKCKTDSMVDVKHKKCRCGISSPVYNEPGETVAVCCMSCKTSTMIDIINKLCRCGRARPCYNEPGKISPICCLTCKTNTMIDVNHKRCKNIIEGTSECPLKQRGNRKYKYYCTGCFQHLFPTDPLTFQIRSKTKENAVRDFINSKFDGFHHDKTMETGHCNCIVKRRIDHRKLIDGTLLVIETDENQHKSYDKMNEETRYDDLFMAYSGKWIYIRFNPDIYLSKSGKRKNPTLASRLEVLEEEINKQIVRIQKGENTELIERIYMFYDGYV